MSNDSSWIETMPETYDRCLGPALFVPYGSHVAALVAARAPQRVLELAAGTGILTAELARLLPNARITATDLNPEMVSWAAHRVANVDWRQADAQRLDYPEASFELVVFQFGVMFFPDKQRAFAEAARVLVPGGTLLFTVWDEIDGSDFAAALMSAARPTCSPRTRRGSSSAFRMATPTRTRSDRTSEPAGCTSRPSIGSCCVGRPNRPGPSSRATASGRRCASS
jgi:SAM-dependent methyltransferase